MASYTHEILFSFCLLCLFFLVHSLSLLAEDARLLSGSSAPAASILSTEDQGPFNLLATPAKKRRLDAPLSPSAADELPAVNLYIPDLTAVPLPQKQALSLPKKPPRILIPTATGLLTAGPPKLPAVDSFVIKEEIAKGASSVVFAARLKGSATPVIAKLFLSAAEFKREMFFFSRLRRCCKTDESAESAKHVINWPIGDPEFPLKDPALALQDEAVLCSSTSGAVEAQRYAFYPRLQMTLASYIDRHQESKIRVPLPMISIILYKLARGLDLIHKAGVAHLDFQPLNILLTIDEAAMEVQGRASLDELSAQELELLMKSVDVRIIDFGHSSDGIAGHYPPYFRQDSDPAFIRADKRQLKICSLRYAPPEYHFSKAFLEPDTIHTVDVWSFGMVAIELFITTPFFGGFEDYEGNILFGLLSSCYFSEALDESLIQSYTSPELLDEIHSMEPLFWKNQKVIASSERVEMNAEKIMAAKIKLSRNHGNSYLLGLEQVMPAGLWSLLKSVIVLDPVQRSTMSSVLAGNYFDERLGNAFHAAYGNAGQKYYSK